MSPRVDDLLERLEQRRRERIARLAAQVDDAHRRQLARDAAAELDPLERLPALRPRRRAAEDGDRAFERRALRRDRARVVARIGLLLVRGVVLLVDADQPEAVDGREDRRAGADDDACVACRDPQPLVAPLGLRQSRVEQRDAFAEARAEAADGLRRERDLRHEHDRAEPALERGRAGLEVDLGLAAAGRAVEEEVGRRRRRRARVRCGRRRAVACPRDAPAPALACERLAHAGLRALAARLSLQRRDERERARRRRAVVVRDPERELDERLRAAPRRRARRGRRRRPAARSTPSSTTSPAALRVAEANLHHRADARRPPAPRT